MAGELNSLADVKFPDVSPVNPHVRSSELDSTLDRRCFLKCAVMAGAACTLDAFAQPLTAILPWSGASAQSDSQFVVEARFYEKLQTKKIKCKLCPRECTVGDRERGYCGVRENRGGTYYSLVHSVSAPRTSIPSRRNRCSTTCRARWPFHWPRPAAT